METVAVIGGGTGGASAARTIRRKLGSKHRIILIEERTEIYNQALFPLLATGKREKQNLTREINRLNQRGIQVLNDRVKKIDHRARNIYTETDRISYDLAIFAAGAELNPSSPPGMQEAGFEAQSLAGAEKIFSSLKDFRGEKVAILVASTHIKCPAAPYEYAFLIEDWFRRRKGSREVEVTLYTPEPAPLHRFGPRLSEAVSELLLKRGIYVNLDSRFEKVEREPNQIILDKGGYPFDLLIFFAEVSPPPLIIESELPDLEGWLEVDRHLMVAGQDRMLGLGDATRISVPAGEILPKMGALAHLQSLVAATNAVKILAGKEPSRTFSGVSG